MKTVIVHVAKTTDLLIALIDDKRLRFVKGKARRQVRENQDHALTWFARGAPGSTYVIEVADPPEARFKHEGTLDESTKDGGIQWFRVSREGDEDA